MLSRVFSKRSSAALTPQLSVLCFKESVPCIGSYWCSVFLLQLLMNTKRMPVDSGLEILYTCIFDINNGCARVFIEVRTKRSHHNEWKLLFEIIGYMIFAVLLQVLCSAHVMRLYLTSISLLNLRNSSVKCTVHIFDKPT